MKKITSHKPFCQLSGRSFCFVLFILMLLPGQLLAQTGQDRLMRVINDELPAGSETGVLLYDLTADRPLFAYRADKLCRPASCQKLLTAVAALSIPEGFEPFVTRFYRTGIVERDTLFGSLHVVGAFDPEFDEAALQRVCEAMSAKGFHHVTQGCRGDVSMSDSLYWGHGWAWDDNPAAYQPYLTPLVYCRNAVRVTAKPSKRMGAPALLDVYPISQYYSLQNLTTSNSSANKVRFKVDRDWLEGGKHITVQGNLTRSMEGGVNLPGRGEFFLHALGEQLQSHGISVHGGYSLCRLDSAASHLLVEHHTPVETVLHQMLKESDNLCAEALFYRMAWQNNGHRHCTAKDGVEALEAFISLLGYSPQGFRLADGSGLSNYNYLTPQLLCSVLRYAYRQPSLFQALYEALPIPSVDGTLKYRLADRRDAPARLRAKTGSFTGISTLSGYVRLCNGHLAAFAIMNQNVLSLRQARLFQDALCRIFLDAEF